MPFFTGTVTWNGYRFDILTNLLFRFETPPSRISSVNPQYRLVEKESPLTYPVFGCFHYDVHGELSRFQDYDVIHFPASWPLKRKRSLIFQVKIIQTYTYVLTYCDIESFSKYSIFIKFYIKLKHPNKYWIFNMWNASYEIFFRGMETF